MLNTRKRHGWSSSYNESGDALHPCWNSEVSTSASATNGPNDIADDQTIATTASAQTVKYTNVAFPNMQQQQQKQPSKKSPPASNADGAALALLYPSIRHFVADVFEEKMFKRMLSDHGYLTRTVRDLVRVDLFLTDDAIIHQVHEACKSVECLDSANQHLELPRASVPDGAAFDDGGSMMLASVVGSFAVSSTDAPTEAAVAAGTFEIALAPRSDAHSVTSSLSGDRSTGRVAHGVGQRRSA